MNDIVRRTLGFLGYRRRSSGLCFRTPAGQEVMRDLIIFCRGKESCYHDDPRKHAVLEGRREVLLRITNHLNLTTEELYALVGGNPAMPADDRESR